MNVNTLFLVVLVTCYGCVNSSWMYMGVASLGAWQRSAPVTKAKHSSQPQATRASKTAAAAAGADTNSLLPECRALTGLVDDQLTVCQRNPAGLQYVARGATLGLMECQYQFQHERWNCTQHVNQTLFDQVVQRGTRETAFIHAVTSAGVVHSVTMACSAGNLTDCSCNLQHQMNQPAALHQHGSSPAYVDGFNEDGWRWGGCSDNIEYGVWFASTFVDAEERAKIASTSTADIDDIKSVPEEVKALVNLHNNEVGRKMLAMLMATKCRCHGVSGSCAVRTCWKSLPPFRRVGDALKDKYETSVEISARRGANTPAASAASLMQATLRRREKRMRREPIADTELVYVERSPNYCRADNARGIMGTKGRECKRGPGAVGPDSCHSLCCGRGHSTSEVVKVERCQCKFVWCCEVKCKTCETVFDRHTCK